MSYRALAAAAPLALLAACSQQPAAPADHSAALDAIHQAEQDLAAAFTAHDAEKAQAVYTAKSAFIAPGTPYLTGLPAIRAAFAQMVADPHAALKLSQGDSFIAASGDLAVTTGAYEFTFTDPETGEATVQHGMNQTVWQKQADGAWKNVSDFNVALPERDDAAVGEDEE